MKHRLGAAILAALLSTLGEAPAEVTGELPESPAGRAVGELLQVVTSGDSTVVHEFLERRFTDSFRNAFPIHVHREILLGLGADFPDPRIVTFRASGPNRASFGLTSKGSGRSAEVIVDFEGDRIAGLAIQPAAPTRGRKDAPPSQASDEHRASTTAELRAELRRLGEAGEFSGVVLLARGGEVLFEEAAGLANRSAKTPVTLDTRFNVGSLTKDFTAVAIYLLAERGLLRLEAPIGTYLDGFPPEVADRVTVDHLLRMQSGWEHYWSHPDFIENRASFRSMTPYLEMIRKIPLDFEPGTRRQYSNVGYEVLGGIVEAVSGRSYYDFVREEIFLPLGMDDTDSFEWDSIVERVAVGYARGPDGTLRANTYLLAPRGSAAGGTFSTARDLLRFYEGIGQGKLLNPSSTARFWGRILDRPGLPDRPLMLAGGAPGVQALVSLDPRRRDFAIVLANVDGPAAERVFEAASSLVPATGPVDAGRH